MKSPQLSVSQLLPIAVAGCIALTPASATGRDRTAMLDDEPTLRHQPRDIEVRLLAGGFYTRLMSEGRFGPKNVAEELVYEDAFNFGGNSWNFNGEASLRRGEQWEITLGLTDFSASGSGLFEGDAIFGDLMLTDGYEFASDFKLLNVSAELSFPWRPKLDAPGNVRRDGRLITDLRLSPVVGARYVDVDHDVRLIGGGFPDVARGGGEWMGLYVGGKAELEFRPDIDLPFFDMLELYATFGIGPVIGGEGKRMWHVRGGLIWHATPHVGFHLGYRLLDLNVERNDYTFDGSLQGLFVAGVIRF